MFVVRTRLTALGTSRAQDALAHFRVMTQAGKKPVVTAMSGKPMKAAELERWIAAGLRAPRSR